MLPLLLPITLAAIYDVTSASTCSKVATFNTALAHGIPGYRGRRGEVTEALAGLDADVICLQEVWLESDMQFMLDGLREKYPHHYSGIHYQKDVLRKSTKDMGWMERFRFFTTIFSPCSYTDLGKLTTRLLPCALGEGCFALLSVNLIAGMRCLSLNCRSQLMELQSSCVSCLVLAGGITDADETCGPNPRQPVNNLNPSGLLVLSKSPLTSVRYTEFFPGHRMVTEKAYIHAQVEGVGNVVCTHLTPLFPIYYEYDMPYDNFQTQQREEIQQLVEKFDSQSHLLLGDFNTGPAVVSQGDGERNLTGEGQEHFQVLMDAGYSTEYLQTDGRCTYCSHNPLVVYYPDLNLAIDFVLSKNQGSLNLSNSFRILDQVLPRPLSDHFGVMTEICPGPN